MRGFVPGVSLKVVSKRDFKSSDTDFKIIRVASRLTGRVEVADSRTLPSISANIGVASIEVRRGFDPDLLWKCWVVTQTC